MESCGHLVSEHRSRLLDAALLSAELRKRAAVFRTQAERRTALLSAIQLKVEKAQAAHFELIHSLKRSRSMQRPTIRVRAGAG